MKYFISLLLSLKIAAAPINIYYEKSGGVSDKIIHTLSEDYLIPLNLISKTKTSECKKVQKKSKLDLCVSADDELYVLNADKEFINKSLKIFLN